MKQVYSARDEVDAYLVKSFLDEVGIETIVQSGGLGSIIGAIPVSEQTLPSLWVREEDYDRAITTIAGIKAGDKPATPEAAPWKCPNCGEMIEPQFTDCWHCGHARPATESA